ncbi:MAG: hypothetical protein ACJ8BC_07990 [Gemmatimonadales bacterium]
MTTPAIKRSTGHRTLALLLALATMILAIGLGTSTKAEAAPKPATPVTTAVTGATDAGVPFVGSLAISRFAVVDGALTAVGTLTGTLGGTPIDATPVAVPVDTAATAATASCEILDLVLGPLDLDLLGLVVHLDVVALNITAVPGPGNLLGNLLCAVAGLLDGPGNPLGGITGLLNRILAILGA